MRKKAAKREEAEAPSSESTGAEEPLEFEELLRELEGVVENLESGDLSLEHSLQAFERGVTLVRKLGSRLDGAERRIEVLTRDDAGSELRVKEIPDDEVS